MPRKTIPIIRSQTVPPTSHPPSASSFICCRSYYSKKQILKAWRLSIHSTKQDAHGIMKTLQTRCRHDYMQFIRTGERVQENTPPTHANTHRIHRSDFMRIIPSQRTISFPLCTRAFVAVANQKKRGRRTSSTFCLCRLHQVGDRAQFRLFMDI